MKIEIEIDYKTAALLTVVQQSYTTTRDAFYDVPRDPRAPAPPPAILPPLTLPESVSLALREGAVALVRNAIGGGGKHGRCPPCFGARGTMAPRHVTLPGAFDDDLIGVDVG